MRTHLKPASNIRVHQRRLQGKYGSRGKSVLIPNPSWICEERLGGTWVGRGCFSSLADSALGKVRIASAAKVRKFLQAAFIDLRTGSRSESKICAHPTTKSRAKDKRRLSKQFRVRELGSRFSCHSNRTILAAAI